VPDGAASPLTVGRNHLHLLVKKERRGALGGHGRWDMRENDWRTDGKGGRDSCYFGGAIEKSGFSRKGGLVAGKKKVDRPVLWKARLHRVVEI